MLKNITIIILVFFYGLPAFAQSGSKAKIDFLVKRIKQRNALTVFYRQSDIPPPHPPARNYDPISPAEYDKLLDYMAILQCELNKIPKQTAINSGLKYICLIKNLSHDGGIRATGFANYNFMFLDCFAPNNDEKRHIIHHEFFHILDKKYNGNNIIEDDPLWSSLNSEDFKYKKNYNAKIKISRWYSGYIDHPQKGFVNEYAMTYPGEDKAEIYAALCMPDQEKTLDEWSKSDEILARKIRYIRKFCLMASKPKGTVPWPDPNAKF
jgi:hypothetical protein